MPQLYERCEVILLRTWLVWLHISDITYGNSSCWRVPPLTWSSPIRPLSDGIIISSGSSAFSCSNSFSIIFEPAFIFLPVSLWASRSPWAFTCHWGEENDEMMVWVTWFRVHVFQYKYVLQDYSSSFDHLIQDCQTIINHRNTKNIPRLAQANQF